MIKGNKTVLMWGGKKLVAIAEVRCDTSRVLVNQAA